MLDDFLDLDCHYLDDNIENQSDNTLSMEEEFSMYMDSDNIEDIAPHVIDDYSDMDSLNHADKISFEGNYTQDEISRFEHEVRMAEHEMNCRKSDVGNWESKVSLNDTKEHRANGAYDNAIRHLNDAKSQYNSAASRYNSAVSKLNNAR